MFANIHLRRIFPDWPLIGVPTLIIGPTVLLLLQDAPDASALLAALLRALLRGK